MARQTRNTGKKQAKGNNPNIADDGKETQFRKGYDPRRNLKGRPKAFDQLRALAQDILQSDATNKDGVTLKWNGTEISFVEFILLGWALDKKQQEKIIEIAFGKVPTDINLNNPDGSLGANEESVYNRVMARISGRLENSQPAKAKENPERDDG